MQAQIRIVDFGSQYTQLIARRIRELGVYSEIVPCQAEWQHITAGLDEGVLRGLILSGGPQSVYRREAPRVSSDIYQLGIPILGICYGLQLMAYQLGGVVTPTTTREYGPATLEMIQPDILFMDLPREFRVWMSHGDRVESVPPGFLNLARTSTTEVAAMVEPSRRLYGVQFHPEVVHTEHGLQILSHFVFHVCRCRKDWDLEQYTQDLIHWVRELSRTGGILVAVSGGVDSTVLATLVHEGAKERMNAVFVDNGLLRTGEPTEVLTVFQEKLKIPVILVDASETFLKNLKGITNPETKRRVVGETFVEVFQKYAASLHEMHYFAQGTLYPDVVESGATMGPSAVIKTHHNLVKAVQDMGLEVIEPFRELFKDEVRKIASYLGIPPDIIRRQPFPGPGLAIRVIGEVTEERLRVLREVDAIVTQEIQRSGWYERLWQSFPVLLPIQTVGVMGDERSYENVVALRVVESLDGMTADWVYLPEPLLRELSARIVNEVPGVNRVVLDITTKPPATIEWE